MSSSAYRRSGLPALTRRMHFYAGLFIAPFILAAALSGALYAFAPTLENIAYRDILTVEPSSEEVDLDAQIRAAQATYPGMEVAQVWPSSSPTEPTRVLLADEDLEKTEQLRSIFVNPHTGEVMGDEPSYTGLGELPLRRWISALHENLHMGEPGEMYSELAASWLWVVALAGLFLWWRTAGRRVFVGLTRREKDSSRRRVLGLHGVVGTWLVVGMLILSVTGITWSHFAGQNVNQTVELLGAKAQPIATSLASASSAVPLTPAEVAGQAGTVLDAARGEGLTGQLRLFVPKDSAHAWQASERWVPWRTTSDEVSVDGESGRVVDTLPFSQLPLFSKLTAWGIYLHMGIMFGLPLQIVLAALALGIAAMVVTGYLMWWRRRPTRSGVAGVPGQAALTRTDWVIIAVVGIPIGLFLPLFGASAAAMLLADRLIAARRQVVAGSSVDPEPDPGRFGLRSRTR